MTTAAAVPLGSNGEAKRQHCEADYPQEIAGATINSYPLVNGEITSCLDIVVIVIIVVTDVTAAVRNIRYK